MRLYKLSVRHIFVEFHTPLARCRTSVHLYRMKPSDTHQNKVTIINFIKATELATFIYVIFFIIIVTYLHVLNVYGLKPQRT